MPQASVLRLYLGLATLEAVRAGRHNFFARLTAALAAKGWRVEPRPTGPAARARAPMRAGYALYLMEEPTHARALTCRRTYVGAFWHIERHARRWDWPVAHARFPAEEIDPVPARRFADDWRRRLFGGRTEAAERGGYIFVPLQGRLLERRSFQTMSPIEMLRETLARSTRPVHATLHPRERYAPEEIAALEVLAAGAPRLTIGKGDALDLLAGCDMVVTQNSAVAFQGYFFRKPAVLFADIDFHHIAASVPRMGCDAAFAAVEAAAPDYDRYLWWFLQDQAINAGRPDSEDRICAALRRCGWPV